MHDHLEVWIDSDILPLRRIGVLSGSAYAHPDTGNFGVFLDSAPDRWGQTLMNRRELLAAKEEGRRPRTIHFVSVDSIAAEQRADSTRRPSRFWTRLPAKKRATLSSWSSSAITGVGWSGGSR